MIVGEKTEGSRPVDPIDEFSSCLIQTPGILSSHSAEDLSDRFGLEPAFVREVQSALRPKVERENFLESFWRGLGNGIASIWQALVGLVSRLTEGPITFPFASGYVALAALIFFSNVTVRVGDGPGTATNMVARAGSAVTVALIVLILVLQLICFGRHGRARYPAYAAAGVWASFFIYVLLALGSAQLPVSPIMVAAFSATFIAIGYLAFGVVASVIGGSIQAQREQTEHERLSRQQILERLFQLQAQFESVKSRTTKGSGKPSWIQNLRKERNLPGLALGVGVLLGLLQVGVVGTAARVVGQGTPPFDIIELFVSIITSLAWILVGYVAGGVRRAFGVLIVVYLASLAMNFIPYGPFGASYVQTRITQFEWVGGALMAGLIALITGVGARLDEYSAKRRRLKEGDPAMLFAEITKLQWQLNRGSQDTCVMVVDVAKSTQMKSNADPLAIEYSFRQYQTLVAERTLEQGGTVISTAGDGVVASFPSIPSALYAARGVQTAIYGFNERVNRLSTPFRVRIGIHAGTTEAQLEEVPYNELIDIAAHVEAVAPVGGIAVTEAVAKQASDESLAEMKQQVDGQSVYIVMNPTF